MPSTLTGQARSESEDETSAPGSYKGEKKREGRREPGQGLQVEPALASCPGKPRPGLSAALRRTGSASTPAQTWEAEEPESSRSKAKEEGSPVQVARGTGAGSGAGKPEAGKNSSSGSGRPQREALQPSGGRCCSEGSSPEDAYPGLEHERFHIQGVPTRPPRENTGSRIRRMRGTCPVPCHLRRLLPVSSLGVSVRGCQAPLQAQGMPGCMTPQSPRPESAYPTGGETGSRRTNEKTHVCAGKKQEENDRPGGVSTLWPLTCIMVLTSPRQGRAAAQVGCAGVHAPRAEAGPVRRIQPLLLWLVSL